MELKCLKHSHEEEASLSIDVFGFLQEDHKLLSQMGDKHFFCEICSEGFTEENDLHCHRLDHVIDKPLFICDDPPKQLLSEIPLEGNKSCQKYNELLICEKCNKPFSTTASSHQTLSSFEESPSYSCDKCVNCFKWKHHLAVHKYPKLEEKALLCHTCSIDPIGSEIALNECDDKTFVDNDQDIPSHPHTKKADVPIIKKVICPACQKEFSSNIDLNKHILIHSGEKLSCKYCEKKFSQITRLNTHIAVHTKEVSFVCNICQKHFSHEGFLRRHVQLHSEGKQFVCKLCHKSFADKIMLKQHFNSHSEEKLLVYNFQNDLDCSLQVHSNEKPYFCDFCQKKFIRKRCLTTHILRLHSDQRPA